MRFLAPLVSLPLIAACMAPFGPANPDRVSLLDGTLAVHFYDGSVCRADVRAAPSGRLDGCPGPVEYDVRIQKPVVLKGAEALLEPYATIRLSRPSDGRVWTWKTPQSDAAGTGKQHSGLVKLY